MPRKWIFGVLLLFGPPLLAQRAIGESLRLPEQVEVRAPLLVLGDLLPTDAPAAAQHRLAEIPLGSAPLPGSFRRLSREEIRRSLLQAPELGDSFVIPPQVVVRRSSRAVSREEIREAIVAALQALDVKSSAWPLAQEIQVPAPALATTGEPELVVQRIEPDPGRNLTRFRMLLPKEDRSLPFYAVVRRLISLPSQTAKEGAGKAAAAASGSRLGIASRRRPPAVVRPGRRAMLLLEAGALRITTAVLPLGSGAPGEQVLVRSLETNRTLRATVVRPDVLKHTLPTEENP
ncbi:MAG TPA: flagella basal body P-ring formation protein FlgA [Terriglobia bacterium]|nr:flagella basal body P-ring formation protein FlgA [Terriglobia bacterium]